MPYAEAFIEDGTGKIRAVWFNQSYIAKQLEIGADIILSGKVTRYKQLQLTNPAYDLIDSTTTGLNTGRLVPIYKRGDLIPLRTMRRLIQSCLHTAEHLEDFIPSDIQQNKKIISIADAVRFLHFPETSEQIHSGRFRIAIDDILPQQIAVELRKNLESTKKSFKMKANIDQVKAFLKTLPFELTASQKRATWDIFQDLESGKPMNRLLQGDVGSGKTIVALMTAIEVSKSKAQTVLLAPTEILAKQHYETFRGLLNPDYTVGLFTRTFAEVSGETISKAEMTKLIESGKIDVCIGTHALIQGKTKFKNLGLVIIDEQHRFGVAQRSFLLNDSKAPHLLSMSATPIPRTLAMSLYADLSVSTLTHVPNGRLPVLTSVVPESQRHLAYDFIKNEVMNGHQAFVVTPRVEDSETSDVRSVKKEFERLQKEVFPKLKLGLLYGKMKGTDKDQVMNDFAAGNLDILVATSVIEIGIDIPKATAIIIEGSERFGLAQLHQLRGRVGRNELQSRCFLFTTEDSHQETERLKMMVKSNDGFALAELDLETRGFGDLFGKQQSGFLFRFPQFITVKALKDARVIAEQIYNSGNLDKRSSLYLSAEAYLSDIHGE